MCIRIYSWLRRENETTAKLSRASLLSSLVSSRPTYLHRYIEYSTGMLLSDQRFMRWHDFSRAEASRYVDENAEERSSDASAINEPARTVKIRKFLFSFIFHSILVFVHRRTSLARLDDINCYEPRVIYVQFDNCTP